MTLVQAGTMAAQVDAVRLYPLSKGSIVKFFKLNMFAGVALAALCATAGASPLFQVTPTALGGATTAAPFYADFIAGTSSELITATSATTFSGSGWVQYSSFTNAGNTILPGTSGLDVTYQLYLTFSFTDTLASGTAYGANSTYNINTLNFKVYADPNVNTTFTQANATTLTNATVGGTTSDDILLGDGSIVSGTAGFDALGGAYINAINTFGLCTGAGTAAIGVANVADANCTTGTGRAFFSQPIPFYSLAFSEYNNTTQGILQNGNVVSITNASGGVDFNGVPEPASLALAGIALLGLGIASKRKSQS